MVLALYRTYRPGTLAEVIGQEHVTQPLARALDAGRTHHAYLFSGPRGCGKTSTARILARSLNCSQGAAAQPCGECRSCVELAPNGPGSMDVVELDAATHRGIDDARELRERAVYAPAASTYRVYIIDEAHQLTNEAANALLKLVEEPPPHLRFIFATTEPDKIIPTIRSRTFHYGFRLVPARTLSDHLAAVCRSEGVAAEPAALAIVARAGAGSVRDSLSVLGQLLAGRGPQGLTYADAVAALGLTDAALIDRFVAALADGEAADMFAIVDAVISAGHDPRRFVTDVLDRLRDLIVLRVDADALTSGLVDAPEEVGQRLAEQAEGLSLAELSRAADLVSAGLGEIKGATAPRLQLELLCARLVLPDPGSDPSAVLARLERLERGVVTGGGALGGPQPHVPEAARPVPSTPLDGPQTTQVPSGMTKDPASRGGAHDVRPTGPPRRPELRRRPDGDRAGQPPADGSTVHADRPAAASRPVDASQAGAEPAGAGRGDGGSPGQIDRVRQAWPAILDRLAASSRVAWTAFHGAAPVSCTGGALAVAVTEPGYARAIMQRGHDERLRQAVLDVLSLDVTVDVLHDPEPVGTAPSRTAVPGRAEEGRRASRDSRAGGPLQAAPSEPEGPTGTRPADVVRAGDESDRRDVLDDEPSPDDPDLEVGESGVELITRELGAQPIGEIDHS